MLLSSVATDLKPSNFRVKENYIKLISIWIFSYQLLNINLLDYLNYLDCFDPSYFIKKYWRK